MSKLDRQIDKLERSAPRDLANEPAEPKFWRNLLVVYGLPGDSTEAPWKTEGERAAITRQAIAKVYKTPLDEAPLPEDWPKLTPLERYAWTARFPDVCGIVAGVARGEPAAIAEWNRLVAPAPAGTE